MGVTLIPPTGAPAGCNSNIELNTSRVDYTINNDIIHHRTGTEEGRSYQVTAGQIQIMITGVCIEENGNTAMENAEILECAANNWGSTASTGTISTYPKVNWRLGNEYCLIQKVTFIDEAGSNEREIPYVITAFIDTRT